MFSGEIKIPKTVKILGLLIGISVITMGLTFDYFDEAFAVKDDRRNMQCAPDKVVVLRFQHNQYLCVDQGTASRWVSLDMAEVVTGPTITSREQCKQGSIHMESPWHDNTICVKRSSVPKLLSQGWISPDYEPEATVVSGKMIDEPCKGGHAVFQNTNTGAVFCVKQNDVFKFQDTANFEKISDPIDYDVETPECNDRYVLMINEENDEEFCIRTDKIRGAQAQGLVEVGESRINSGAGSTECKGGLVHMKNPNSGVIICEKRSDVPKRQALGWLALDYEAAPLATPSPTASCKGGEAILQCVNCQASDRTASAGDIICSKQVDVGKFTSKGWVRIDKAEKQTADGTIQSEQEGGRNHEAHQIARLLAPENTVKVGVVTYTASVPVQVSTLQGPLRAGDNSGQPTWSPDGSSNFAITLSGEAKSSGTYEFAGQALALHTESAAPFQATYTISFHSLPAGDYAEGVVDYGTMKSGPDPGIGHESHSLAILLPPSDSPYHDGVLTYAASEPVQMVVLHGPLGPGEDIGQPTWSPDGETKFGLTFVDDNMATGSFEFTGNAVAAHTMNTDGFSITYSLATRR